MKSSTLPLTTDVIIAFARNNKINRADFCALIGKVATTIDDLGTEQIPQEPLVPAVPISRSIHKDYLVCLEDGKRFKTLKRHLMAAYGLTPDAYRKRWGLPSDYPMTTRTYSAARSVLAKHSGLGRSGRNHLRIAS